jgi:hypothetical protein
MSSLPERDRVGPEVSDLRHGIPASPAAPAQIPANAYSTAIHAMLDDFARANGAL